MEGRAGFLISIFLVSNPELTIEAFDLHICSCALLCTVFSDGEWVWDLHLTRSCARMYWQKRVCAWNLH